ncbi:acetyl-CoA carboxylase biotin carboxyl carrier protein [Candidatus Liberibacter sp.]|uniref:acetyl-CoA carboxylase biotin carboxyl carrier protein n=1 Tax=Candidatus Liberibacter sp. TaxID=34022 RepID=UPI0015F4968E|nr:acetyl-CoA carboxylase biotin carboxyl carrier protein [Candidatus Liberibacter sp.]MBA5724249.1 acetyl-CoA carboxylase biotin carboxyl carrier protein [Candidatus Liberibacter sp.]
MTDKKQKINLALIRNLANILNETDLTEIEVDSDGMRIRLLRSSQKKTLIKHRPEIEEYTESEDKIFTSKSSHNQNPDSSPSIAAIDSTNHDDLYTVTSPMVGTAYLAPSPGSDPFIKKDYIVTKGQTLLIIEAMKTMNHIVAQYPGKIKEINVKDGQLVEYGESLLVLEHTEDSL